MAEIGMTKLEAVNNLLRTVGMRPVSALDAGGTSDASEAERVLDEVTELVQTDGHPSNTHTKSYTTSSGVAALDSDVLQIEVVWPPRHAGRCKAIDGEVYNTFEDTNDVGDGGSATIGVVQRVEIPWAQCTPDLKHAILSRAKTDYQMLVRGRQDLGELHKAREAESAATTDKGDMPPTLRQAMGTPVAQPRSGSDQR